MGLTGQLGDGQGEAGGGDRQQHVVDLIGGVEVGFALGPQDIVQGDFVEEADQLHRGYRCRQNGRSGQEGLLFGLVRHEENTSNP